MPRPQSTQIKPNYPFLLNRKSVQAQGLIGWWPGDGSGGVIHDLSGRHNHGNLTNFDEPFTKTSGWVAGPGNSAIAFDGNDNYVDCGLFQHGSSRAISYGCFVRPLGNNVGKQPQIISKWGDNSVFDASSGFLLHMNNALSYRVALGGPNVTLESSTPATSGVLVHVMVVYNGATVKIYINGREDASTTATAALTPAVTVPMLFGYSPDPFNASYFQGTIEDVRVYNRALTPKEVLDTYRNPWDLRYQEIKRSHFIAAPNNGVLTDSATLSESITRIGSFNRTTTDAPTLSESATAVSVSGNVTFDAVTTSETATRVFVGQRTTTDAPTTSESVVSIVGAIRTATDSPTTSESVVQHVSYSRQATDAINISVVSNVSGTGVLGNDTPTISETVTAQKMLFKSLSNTLTITQSNLVATPVQSVEQGLAINQSVGIVTVLSKSASNSLSFSQSADYFQFLPLSLSHTLTITQSVDTVQTTGIGNVLAITQDVVIEYDPHLDQQFQVLEPTQTVTVSAIFSRSLTQPVTIVQTVVPLKIISRSVTSSLSLVSSVVGGPLHNASNTLIISQSVAPGVFRNKSLSQSIAVTQSVGLQMILNRSLTSTLVFTEEHPKADGAGGFIQVPNVIVTQGGSTPPKQTVDNLPGPAPDIECCPIPSGSTVYQSATRAIVLPNPEFSDTEGNVAAVSIKRTITGCTYSYLKKSANRKLKYKFVINQRKAYELRRFLLDFLGDRISMTNWKGELWTGYLLTDPAEITSTSRGGICNGDMYEVELEYQGVRVN